MKKVFVSGCFDLLHSGHIAFLQRAARLGRLYVSIGSDQTIMNLKKRPPIYNQAERQYMLEALKCVHKVYVGPGTDMLDFKDVLRHVHPDIFYVNADGDTPAKKKLMLDLGIEYIVDERVPADTMPVRSTTELRSFMCKK